MGQRTAVLRFVFFRTNTPSTSKRTKRNQLSGEKKQEFHDVLKKSIVERQTSLSEDDGLPNNELKVAQQMEEFHATISSSSRQKMYIYCLIGRNLTVLKGGKKAKNLLSSFTVIYPQTITAGVDLLLDEFTRLGSEI